MSQGQGQVAGRYATALFELARDAGVLDGVAASVARVQHALSENADFSALLHNPVLSREAVTGAVTAVADVLGLEPSVTKFLGVMARNRRLAALPAALTGFAALLASHRGEVTAHVTAAHALNDAQVDQIKQQLRRQLGRDVGVHLSVDPAILGGLVVNIGSKRIDSSIRTKLDTLSLAMKG